MKTTTSQLTSFVISLVCALAICPQAYAGGLLTSPSEDEPPPVVEQQQSPVEEQKKPEETPGAKDADAKATKAAKKKKDKDVKSADAAKSGETADAKKAEDEKAKQKKADADAAKQKKVEEAKQKKADADAAKQKKAEKKKKSDDDKSAAEKDSEKSVDKTAADKDGKKSDDKGGDKAADQSEKKENTPATALDGAPKPKSTVPLPKRLASFTTGAFLGYPVAMAKRTVHQTKAGNRDFIGDSTNPIKVGIATMVSLPFGFVGGVFEGAQYSIYNSWKGSGEEPFGKSTFSLDDD